MPPCCLYSLIIPSPTLVRLSREMCPLLCVDGDGLGKGCSMMLLVLGSFEESPLRCSEGRWEAGGGLYSCSIEKW